MSQAPKGASVFFLHVVGRQKKYLVFGSISSQNDLCKDVLCMIEAEIVEIINRMRVIQPVRDKYFAFHPANNLST